MSLERVSNVRQNSLNLPIHLEVLNLLFSHARLRWRCIRMVLTVSGQVLVPIINQHTRVLGRLFDDTIISRRSRLLDMLNLRFQGLSYKTDIQTAVPVIEQVIRDIDCRNKRGPVSEVIAPL